MPVSDLYAALLQRQGSLYQSMLDLAMLKSIPVSAITQQPTTEEANSELEAILKSRVFSRAKMLKVLLRYIVEKSFLPGRDGALKESTVAVEVFKKPPDFDLRANSIVRVFVSRLRDRLADYYKTEGQASQLRIGITKGHYYAKFSRPSERGPEPETAFDGELFSQRVVVAGLQLVGTVSRQEQAQMISALSSLAKQPTSPQTKMLCESALLHLQGLKPADEPLFAAEQISDQVATV